MADQKENLKLDSKLNFFKFDLKADKQKAFNEIYKSNAGDWTVIKSELASKPGFTDAIINNLEFTHQLSSWGNNNAELVSIFQKDKQTNSLRDIALNLNKTEFIDKVISAAPAGAKKDKQAFALNLHQELFQLQPTAMLVNMVKDPQVPFLNDAVGINVANVLAKQPDFNIKTTSVYEVINNAAALKEIPAASQDAVKTQLKTLQRIVAISPLSDAVPALYNANVHTAMQISAMPKAQFMAVFSESDLDENTLAQIHSNAQQAQVRNEHFLVSIREAAKPTGVAMIDKSLNAIGHPQSKDMRPVGAAAVAEVSYKQHLNNTLEKHNLSWDLLFADADFCECGECNSVYSAAAYYVELLNYLRNNNLDAHAGGAIAIKPDPKDITNTPLEKLFDRRPDLGCLELTCKNTNTVLPYVDLVNEVMENYVAFKHLKPFNVLDETSGELLAEPQHTEYQAYCILKSEVYPFTLPYHQPIDAARIYLKHLDTSRYELIDTFRKNNTDADTELTRLKDEALDRAADAEYLKITNEEYVILTKECFESKALTEKLKNKSYTEDEYKTFIGVKPVCEYYGFDDDITMLGEDGLTLIKQEFLRRTGIDYFNLVDLLLTATINPCMPKGKSKAIMESLRFSYRFLQNYAAVNGIDKMADMLVKGQKLAELLPMVKEGLELMTGKATLSCPKPDEDAIDITDKDIVSWVKCHFEKVGKLIVIETGNGCVNGEIHLTREAKASAGNSNRLVFENCKLQTVNVDNHAEEIGSIDKKNGKISAKDINKPISPNLFKGAKFIGNRGEKGIFFVIADELYLILTEQKDSCDLDSALLQHLDGTSLIVEEYDKIHRFIRLWRKLGWTIDETDKAIVGLSAPKKQLGGVEALPASSICEAGTDECCDTDGECGDCDDDNCNHPFEINPKLIHQLAAVRKLLEKTGLEVIKQLSFWADISSSGEKSLYQRLFLTHNVLGIDKVFKVDSKGSYLVGDVKLLDHLPVVMASLNLSADDVQAIMQFTTMEDKLTLGNLSILYRYRLLSKILSLRIPDFISVLPLFGNIFADADASLEFMNRWGKMDDAGFSYRELNYVLKNVDYDKKPFSPSHKTVLQISKTLYDGLNAIDEAHKDLVADPVFTDAALIKINIKAKATSDIVRAKASLLFETSLVEKMIGLLEGANQFTTNAPKNLEFTIADTKTLKAKLKYDKILGAIQITGALTAAEVADYQAITNDPLWAKALARIEKQQSKLFKELLSGIFDNEKTKTAAEKTNIEAILKAGDVAIPLDKIPDGQADTNTAPQKRVAFLEIFLPYLRQQLAHRFVIDTLSSFVGLENKVTDVLASEILMQGIPAAPIYSIFEKIKDSSKPVETNWNGYLIPASDASYTIIIKNSDTMPVVSIDGVGLNFARQEDPDNEWWSDAIPLQAGKLYKLATTGVDLKNIFWKKPTSAISLLPSSALIPDFASKQCEPALIALKKAAILVAGFVLSADEIKFLAANKADFDSLDFNAPTLNHWLRLEGYTRLRNSLPSTKTNILAFWNWVRDATSDSSHLSERLVELTNWNKASIDKLIAANHFNVASLADYRNEITLLKLQKSLQVADKIGMDINLLFDWAIPTSNFKKCRAIADSIKFSIRAKYNQTDWEQVVKPLHDELRNNQKDALIAYLLQQKELIAWNVTDADGLFEYFLIDVQMSACMETSRIKQAISSVQLFVQRCFLGLEEEHNGIKSDVLDKDRWNWMQRYRVWEANRKVFLYPENWIESNLRDDKSPFFKELESELLQKDINKQNVTDALKAYLYKVDEVANMEVVGLYIDGTRSTVDGKVKWSENAKLHVFSRTRNAPYFFFYRYLALDEMNWYPWEKMQVDIPSYDSENQVTHQVIGNGCYLAPVAWNGRLLIFFPQIMKKSRPDANSSAGSFNSLGHDANGIDKSKPLEYFEIKMGWSEYRNSKWTQKQLSNNVLIVELTDPATKKSYPGRRIDQFTFIPDISDASIVIRVEDLVANDTITFTGFTFSGSRIEDDKGAGTGASTLPSSVQTEFGTTEFQKFSSKIQSLQLSANSWGNDDATFTVDKNTVQLSYNNSGINSKFYYSETHELLKLINLGQLENFFEHNKIIALTEFGEFNQNGNLVSHELKHPYSLYNWELFFHTPMLLADALSKAQHFAEAMKWYHHVFNPIADGNDSNRFWQFLPFQKTNSKRVLDSIFNNLKPNTSDQAISEWRNKPFMPHVVARSRPVAYMKWVVMKYIDNLLAWGDYLFRQDTIESINQATQIYVLAGHILGPKPMMIPKRGKIKPQTYLSLLDKWDAFGNAVVELEIVAPFSNQTPLPFGVVSNEIAFANIYGLASSLYFCIPNNPKLMGYWDTLADRLYKIRHCENIQGVFRKLPLFEPPIDPALLVKAAAQGLSIDSVLNDLNSPMPNYRFYYLLQKALELCNELKSLGGAMLSAIEKKDNETVSLLRAKHEGVMQNLMMEIKKKQLEEAQKNIESLKQNRASPEARMKYYLKLSGLDESLVPNDTAQFNGLPNEIVTVDGDSGLKLISFEKEDMDKASEAADWQDASGKIETLASILHIIPAIEPKVSPFGVGVGAVVFSGAMLGNAAQAFSRGIQTHVGNLNFKSSSAGKKGGFTRALQERIFQANSAGYELKQIDKQITAQEIRIDIANQEITNQQKAIDNSNEVEEFIKNKFSNEELYTWMRGSIKTLYHQVYSLAYDLAKKAERTYCFERGFSSSNFIQAGYFDAGREGLLAGEQLYVGLKQLEAAYQNERGYDYEVTKHISLNQLDPLAIIQLRETGKCEFVVPEALFDLDYSGHFKRRIKSISISIPCVAGPYTGINATLSLLENKFRNTAIGGKTYEENTEETDARFSAYKIPISAVAVSSAQNDSGMFELNFKDERYLPFEGAGVISKWRLELPTIRQYDYHTISDAIVHVRYTSCEGGERLKIASTKSLTKQLENIEQALNETGLHIVLNMKHDLPNEWHLLKKSGSVDLIIEKTRLPYMAQMVNTSAIEDVIFIAQVDNNPASYSINIDDIATELAKNDELKLCLGHNVDIKIGTTFKLSIPLDQLDILKEMIMVVKFSADFKPK